MMCGQRALNNSQAPSPEGSEDDEARSPVSNDEDALSPGLLKPPSLDIARGRKGKSAKDGAQESKRDAMDVLH